MHSAELQDLFIDDDGRLWRVVAICGEPTVTVQEVEPEVPDNPVQMRGGVSGMMWNGLKKLSTE